MTHELDDEAMRHLNQAHLEQAKSYGTAVILVAGAALSLSVAVFTRGAGPGVAFVGVGWLKASWGFFAFAMLTQVFTLLTSLHAIRKTLSTGAYESTWGEVTEFLNWAIGIMLGVGFVSMIVFAFQNVG